MTDSSKDIDELRSKDRLFELYHSRNLPIAEIADMYGCSTSFVYNRMVEYGVERRESNRQKGENAPWRDGELMEQLYVEKELLSTDIADRFDCNRTTVTRWLDRHGIERRSQQEEARRAMYREPASFATIDGYERWTTSIHNERSVVLVHRLVAIAEFGFDAVCGRIVHHKNGVRWDNRPSNLELIDSHSEHMKQHYEDGDLPAMN